ncbi:hypothetical protein DSCO28_04970 [Desulfosarcina ovata subsp. sediminis]|uniref:Type III-B CRISPR module-associated protein Cmr3 n=1 Tax=Desulfosarcina ovata subsp. sediminis TaxID=885957 RepID=A0A5K7ZG96_9BACT|nr:type III-B CRISPR module-associated protein Cmr3 [Desulfosarcina ovata]BBO79931.1 hypothetical protein DSCO28_04970 [Desulfosarcina ovata subsp. sediminis]
MNKKTWRITPLDSWFFRESRPMESIGGSELGSVFPPPTRTLIGAIRTAIGNHHNVDWVSYETDPKFEKLRDQIGVDDDFKSIKVHGVWLSQKKGANWKRLFPAPRNLVYTQKAGKMSEVIRLQVGQARYCDLGQKVRMAVAPNGISGINGVENHWVNEETLASVLNGRDISSGVIISSQELYEEEPRLGIARDNQIRNVEEGRLYQTRHIRMKPGVAVEIDVSGIDESFIPPSGILRLGGEGRGAAFEVIDNTSVNIKLEKEQSQVSGLIVTLLAPMYVEQDQSSYTPFPGFKKMETDKQTVWKGHINGKSYSLHCAVIGKPMREGGWSMQKKQPRQVRSLIPPGSVFYLTPEELDPIEAIDKIHMTQLDGNKIDNALGYGLVAAGIWNESNVAKEEI